MKKILFPFKPNKENNEAFVYAAKIARSRKAELILLNVYQIDVDNSIDNNRYKKLLKEKWVMAYREVAAMKDYYINGFTKFAGDFNIRFDYRFIHGNFYKEFIDITKKEDIDLIVFSTSCIDNNKEFIGKVFKENPTPMLAVPRSSKFQPVENILYTTDFEKFNESHSAFHICLKLADVFGAKIHFVNITDSDKKVKYKDSQLFEEISEVIIKSNKHTFHSIIGQDLSASISDYIEKNSINIVTVIKHHRGFFESIFHESFTNKITEKSGVPVLIFMESE